MTQTLDLHLAKLLKQRKAMGGYVRPLIAHDPFVLHDLSSNDYLSLTVNPKVRQRYLDNLAATPRVLGSTGSRLLSGASSEHDALERRLANYMGSEDALLCNSGWDANVAFFSTVPQKTDIIIYDELMHASFFSGFKYCAVPKSQRLRLHHNDPAALAQILSKIPSSVLNPTSGPKPTVFLVVESLYSMDGDFGPLPAFLDTFDLFVPREQQCTVVDEAHSCAIYGAGGRGVSWALGPEYLSRIHVRLITFSKGWGCSGSALLMSSVVKLFMTNTARAVIFTTAPAHNVVVSISTALDVISSSEGDTLRQDLYDSIDYLNHLIDDLLAVTPPEILRRPDETPIPFPLEANTDLAPCPPSAVVALVTPDPDAIYRFFLERGIVISSIVPPAVPYGHERLRICLRSGLDRALLNRVADLLAEFVRSKAQFFQLSAKL